MSAHATQGGVTDVNVDQDYTAPPGTPPAEAIEKGIPDAASGERPEQEESINEQRDSDSAATGSDDGQRTDRDADGNGDVPGDAGKPAKRAGVGSGNGAAKRAQR